MPYFVSPDDSDDVVVILDQIQIRTADYNKPRWVSCNKNLKPLLMLHATCPSEADLQNWLSALA